MLINIFTRPEPRGVVEFSVPYWLMQVEKGFRAHGINSIAYKRVSPDLKNPLDEDCKLSVHWGVRAINREIRESHKKNGGRCLVIELGALPNRSKWLSMGFNGLAGLGDYNLKPIMPADRWIKYHARKMKPWSINKKGHILLLGQTPNDSALYGFDIMRWISTTKGFFNREGVKCVYRAHPGKRGAISDAMPDLQKQIAEARTVVTYNSTAGVEAILMGKPTIALHKGSMVWEMTKHKLEDWDSNYAPDRAQWACQLAYKMWRSEEVESGMAWEHLRTDYA